MPRKTNIQLRRGSYSAWGSANPVLNEGEPGYDTTNKTIKVGDATSSWSDLPEVILSASPSIESGGSKTYPLVLISPEINFKNTGETNIFTVPTGHLFFIDRMEVVTTSISSAGNAPYVRFGKSGSSSEFLSATQSQSNSQGSRHIVDSPQDGESSGTVVTFGVTAASTAGTHKGLAIVRGYLVQISAIPPAPTSTPPYNPFMSPIKHDQIEW